MPTLESHIVTSDTTEGRKYVANPYFHMVDTTGQQLPYISRQDELYANDNEVRILKLVNGEVDYKSQSLTLAAAPLLLDSAGKGRLYRPAEADHRDAGVQLQRHLGGRSQARRVRRSAVPPGDVGRDQPGRAERNLVLRPGRTQAVHRLFADAGMASILR